MVEADALREKQALEHVVQLGVNDLFVKYCPMVLKCVSMVFKRYSFHIFEK